MKAPPPALSRHWHPVGSSGLYEVPAEGAIVAWRHAAWRVVEIRDIPEDLRTEADHDRLKHYTATAREKSKPRALTLRPVGNSDIKIRASQDCSVFIGGRQCYGASLNSTIHVFPDEHYPVCASCGEPVPCREKEIEREMERADKNAGRYELAGVCPSCQEPVTKRQKSMTFGDNIEVPLGPPVTFHLRGECRDGAMRYEQQWAALDPKTRRTTLSCPGTVTAHNDGTYECTEFDRCPGPTARHCGYQSCRCPDCHANGPFGCYPSPTDVLLDRRQS